MPKQERKTRTSPEVDTTVLNDFKTTVRAFHQGKIKGRYGTSVEEAMRLLQAIYYLRSPMRLKHIERHVDGDQAEIDDFDEYRQRIAEYVDENREAIEEAAQMIESGVSPIGGPTELAKATGDEGQTESDPFEAIAEVAGSEEPSDEKLERIAQEFKRLSE